MIRIECAKCGQTAACEPHAALRAFRKIVFLFICISKCRNIVKWHCGQGQIYA